MLDEDAVLEDADLGAVADVAHDHDPVDALAPGQELGLGDDRPAPSGLAALASALLLGFEAGRTLERGHLVAARLADLGRHAGLVLLAVRATAAAAAAGPATGRRAAAVVLGAVGGRRASAAGVGVAALVRGRRLGGVRLVRGLRGLGG